MEPAFIDEGYIKFECHWLEQANAFTSDLSDLLAYRDRMHQRQLIGYDARHKVGFGNISERLPDGGFVISGTQTGHLFPIKAEHFTTVHRWDTAANQVWCRGPVKASSESMTHATLYDLDESTQVVIHVHHKGLWEKLLNVAPTTGESVPYGTPEMAAEIKRLYAEEDLASKGLLAMAGHEDGVIAVGPNFEVAAQRLLAALN